MLSEDVDGMIGKICGSWGINRSKRSGISSHALTVVVGNLDVHLSAGSVLVHAVLCCLLWFMKVFMCFQLVLGRRAGRKDEKGVISFELHVKL